MFGVNTTIQTFSNEIKSFIFGKTNYDFDMKNAAFGFCRYIINTYFPSKLLEYGTLIDYSNQREKYFKNGNNKLSYITILFSSNPKSYIKKYNDDDVNELILQIHNFQQLVIDNKHLFSFVNLKNAKDTNGSKLSYIIFGYENELLQECIAEFKDIIKSPIFDGFITSKSCNLNKTLSRLNEIGEKYGIEFTNKSFMNIVIPENIDNSTDYEMVKEEFEDNHFYVEYPSEFIVEDNDGSDISIRRYSKKDFADVVAPFNVEEKPFLPLWLKDRKRRKYKGIKWCPKITNDKDYYNSFQGFKSVEVDEVDMELVNPFIDHWNLLCNGEEEVVDYVLKYLSHMIQKPEEIPQVALLFQGLQGTGKDIATSQLGFMVGQKLIHKEEKCENIFGTFNSCMENKLVLQVNEISGTDGFKHKESFKDLITAENLNIRRMRTELYDTPNYLRCFLFSNNLTPIQIPQDDRRYMVIKTGNPQSKGYYSKLVKHYTNEEVNNHIYTYLKRMDIVGYTPHGNRVETEAYRNMKEMCKNPFYEFFYEILKNDEWFGRYEVKGKIYFSSKKILDSYKEYTDGYNIIINFKNIKSVILNLGGKEKKIFKNHKQYRGYEINVEEVIEKLEQHYGVNDEEVINLDSDSDDEYDSDDDDRFRVINKNNEI
tara:strand:- start:283 stop:2244 length:1962 start_codon:yes stop_codon:yes gene_type:complete